VVFYGSNDGTIRAINGNQTATYDNVTAGGEFWSFVPKETISKLNRLRTNSPEVRLATTQVATGNPNPPVARDYFADGPVSYYEKMTTAGTASAVYVYAGLRRGGRGLYALDATAIGAPKLMWSKTQADLTNLGQTWSEAKVTRLKGYTDGSGTPLPVLIMGGGYDADAEDPLTPADSTTMGNRVYVLDAATGTLLKEFTFTGMRSVPADLSLMDADYDGYVDRAYGSDVHGNVFRIDFEVRHAARRLADPPDCLSV
jgi:type IV pilus assembly protein PilY1